MRNNKGQAALEFLMTYGWAILAAIVVIGVLAYFGVFSPSSYVPNQCVISAPFGCNAGIVEAAGVTLEVINGGGEQYNITSIDVSTSPGSCTANTTVGSVAADSKTTVVIPCTGLTAGSKFKGQITISYTKAGSALTLTSSGTIVDKV